MDDVRHFESGEVNVPDAVELVVRVLVGELLMGVGEDSVALTLADVEGFPVAGINEPIDVRSELLSDLGSEVVIVRHDGSPMNPGPYRTLTGVAWP
jgi:hypothetical protein